MILVLQFTDKLTIMQTIITYILPTLCIAAALFCLRAFFVLFNNVLRYMRR